MQARISVIKSNLIAMYAPAHRGDYQDYIVTIVVNILAQLCIVVSGILTARLLGPVGKGELTTVLFIPNLMLSIGILSLPQATAFYISRRSLDGRSVQATGFWMSLGLGLVEAAILYPLIPILLGSKGVVVILIARISLIYLPIAFTGFTLLGIEQGYQHFKKYNLLKHLPTFLYALLLIGMAIIRAADVSTFVMGFLLSQLIASTVLVVSSGRRLILPHKDVRIEYGRSLFKQGLVYTMPALSGILLMRADLAILIPTVSAGEVGLYSAALAIAMGQNVLTSSIIQVNFPKVCSANQMECYRIILNQLKKAIAPIFLIAVSLALVSPLIIKYLLGSAFAAAHGTTLILIAAIMVWCVGQIIDNGLRGAGLGLPSSLSYVGGIAVLLVFAACFVPRFRALGMAIAFFLAQVATTAALLAALYRFNKKTRNTSLSDSRREV
jgi:O-antigen/teichoic acid export membrane protein